MSTCKYYRIYRITGKTIDGSDLEEYFKEEVPSGSGSKMMVKNFPTAESAAEKAKELSTQQGVPWFVHGFA